MIGHFIRFKGKGVLVILLPLIIGIILFLVFDGLNWNDRYVFPISLLSSSFIIWFYDSGPALLRDGFSNRIESKHTFCWIEIKYWAMVLGIAGCVTLGNLLKK
jgi:hypothetical protein